MGDVCTDGRFDLIERFKRDLVEATNIETSPEEMAVLDSILFRMWQMGWLDRLEQPTASTWHRVEEPPKQYGAFAVACVYDGKFYWCKGIYLDGKWLREGDGIEIPADYWMPIEPPKEGE